MFESARIKLTVWYVCVIMLVSVLFSITLYNVVTREIQRLIHRIERERQNPYFAHALSVPRVSISDLTQSQNRVFVTLILINGGIFVASSFLGYFLAGRTLRPIKLMVDEQNLFIGDSSHELRTPLTALSAEMEAALLQKHITDSDARNLIKSNLEEIKSLQRLSDNLIGLAEGKEKKHLLSRISLLNAINASQKKVSPLAKKKHIQIKNIAEDVFFEANLQKMVEVFTIILDNAIKYSNKNSLITISSETDSGSLKINIVDSGVGISEEDLPHIFDRFYRADKSRSKTDVKGFGLGLSIAKKIVESYRGSIHVKSVLRKGTTISLIFPTKK